MKFRQPCFALVAAVLTLMSVPASGAEPALLEDWIQLSNVHAIAVLETLAKYDPEGAGRQGLDRYDEATCDLLPRVYERSREDVRALVDQLQARLREERHPLVKQDLELLVQVLNDRLSSDEM